MSPNLERSFQASIIMEHRLVAVPFFQNYGLGTCSSDNVARRFAMDNDFMMSSFRGYAVGLVDEEKDGRCRQCCKHLCDLPGVSPVAAARFMVAQWMRSHISGPRSSGSQTNGRQALPSRANGSRGEKPRGSLGCVRPRPA